MKRYNFSYHLYGRVCFHSNQMMKTATSSSAAVSWIRLVSSRRLICFFGLTIVALFTGATIFSINMCRYPINISTSPAFIPRSRYNKTELSLHAFKIVFSLTTSPKRIHNIEKVLSSLLEQEYPPDLIQINLPIEFKRTGETYEHLELLAFLNHSKIRIHRCDDLGPATKLLPTLSTIHDPDTLIITVDDDTIYGPNLVSLFKRIAIQHPQSIIAGCCGDNAYLHHSHRATNSSKCRFFEAFAGVGYRRSFFGADFKEYMDLMLKDSHCFRSDDLMFSNYFSNRDIIDMKKHGFVEEQQLESGYQGDALHKLDVFRGNHDGVYHSCASYMQKHGRLSLKVCTQLFIN